MQRVRFFATLAAGVVLTAALGAQGRPDFSGTWVSASPGQFPPEQRVTITQDATSLTIDGTAYRMRGTFDGVQSSMSSTPYPMRTTYILDGLEHPQAVVATFPSDRAMPARGTSSRLEDGVFKATWTGQQLVVMKYERHRHTAADGTATSIRRTIQEIVTLSADGSLVWETVQLSDPLPGSSQAAAPTQFRRVFKRN